MADSVRKRKRCISYPNLKEEYIEDVVESLNLTIPVGELSSLLEKIRSKTERCSNDSLEIAVSIYGVLSYEYDMSERFFFQACRKLYAAAKEEDQKWSGLSEKDSALVQQYHKNGSLAPSDVSWAVLQKVGIVNLAMEAFVAAANSRKKEVIPCDFALEPLKHSLSKLSNTDYLSEQYLAAVCTLLFAYCVDWLGSICKGKFTFRMDSHIAGPRGFSDLSILRIIESNSTDTIAIIEIKTDVPLSLDQITSDAGYSKSLAQLVYMGKETCKCQSFMPLLVLTNCAIWHIFDLDTDGQPKSYCFVGQGSQLPLSPSLNFDVSVCSELIAFVQQNEKELSSVQSQQQPAVK